MEPALWKISARISHASLEMHRLPIRNVNTCSSTDSDTTHDETVARIADMARTNIEREST